MLFLAARLPVIVNHGFDLLAGPPATWFQIASFANLLYLGQYGCCVTAQGFLVSSNLVSICRVNYYQLDQISNGSLPQPESWHCQAR